MFRTSSVHHQERFVEAVFADFGNGWTCRVVRVFMNAHLLLQQMVSFQRVTLESRNWTDEVRNISR